MNQSDITWYLPPCIGNPFIGNPWQFPKKIIQVCANDQIGNPLCIGNPGAPLPFGTPDTYLNDANRKPLVEA